MFSLTLPHQSPEQAMVGIKLARDINKKERKKEELQKSSMEKRKQIRGS